IKLNFQTIINHAKGKTTHGEANASKSWVTPKEAHITIAYAAELATRGRPLSHRCLKEHVDLLLHARLGADFPGIGKQWTHRFLDRYSEHLATELATAREAICGGAVNPTALAAWFDNVLKSLTASTMRTSMALTSTARTGWRVSGSTSLLGQSRRVGLISRLAVVGRTSLSSPLSVRTVQRFLQP
ncbi:hypothetical protein EV715DRAFT_215033, partial [Schizophyllum commune]